MKRLFLLAATLLLAQSAVAHDFWILPSTFRPRANEGLTIRLMQGEHFRGDPVARNDRRIERFIIRDGGGEHRVAGTTGDEPAGRMARIGPGLSIVGYRTFPLRHGEMSAGKFEAYLREEGLERIIALRAKRGHAKRPATERFSRSAKALVRGPGQSAMPHDQPLGLRLEIIPETDPSRAARSTLPVRVLFDGQPLEGALVTAMHKDDPAATRSGRSDRNGRIALPVAKDGVWLIKTVHMIEAPEGSGVDWESIWATLTFEAAR